jgi:hypothetical protein
VEGSSKPAGSSFEPAEGSSAPWASSSEPSEAFGYNAEIHATFLKVEV